MLCIARTMLSQDLCPSVCLSHAVFHGTSDLEWPLTRISRSRYYSTSINSKMVQDRTAPFQWPWTTHNQHFRVVPFFEAEYLSNGTRYRHSYIGILIGTYTLATQVCHLKWPWVNFSDLSLSKYSMTRQLSFLLLKVCRAVFGGVTDKRRFWHFRKFRVLHLDLEGIDLSRSKILWRKRWSVDGL